MYLYGIVGKTCIYHIQFRISPSVLLGTMIRNFTQLSAYSSRILARRLSSGSSDSTCTIISSFYHLDQYGFSSPLPYDPAFSEGVITTVANTAFGDGTFSADEKKWMKGHFLSLNYPEEIVDKALNDCTNSLEKVVQLIADPRLQNSKKMLIYDCFRLASVDGECTHLISWHLRYSRKS